MQRPRLLPMQAAALIAATAILVAPVLAQAPAPTPAPEKQQSQTTPKPTPRPSNLGGGSGGGWDSNGGNNDSGFGSGFGSDSGFGGAGGGSRRNRENAGTRTPNRNAQNANQNNRNAQAAGQQGRPRNQTGRNAGQGRGQQAAQRRSSGAASSYSIGSLKMTIDRNARVMRLVPKGGIVPGTAVFTEGSEFHTTVRIEGPDNPTIDRISIALDYPSDVIEAVSVNDAPIAGFLQGPPTSRIDAERGVLLYEARLAAPATMPTDGLIAVTWRALRPTTGAAIRFSSIGDRPSMVAFGDRDILGVREEPEDATMAMEFEVQPKDSVMRADLEDAPALNFGWLEQTGGVRLALRRGPTVPVAVGDVFHVDLEIDNSASSALDAVSVVIEFDPRAMQILDTDLDNPITAGVNILDGPFTSRFPFEYHIENNVTPGMGRITYRKGTQNENMMRGRSGTLARIYVRALRPVDETAMRFVFSKLPGYPTTDVTFVGESVLGTADDPSEAVADAPLSIVGRGESLAAR